MFKENEMTKMDELFDEWKKSEQHVGKRFIEDGIIDDDKRNKSKLKVMFLLKEAYWTPVTMAHRVIKRYCLLNESESGNGLMTLIWY